MELNYQEKVNLSFLFLTMIEKLYELYKQFFFPIIDNMYKGKENPTEVELRIYNFLNSKYKNKEKLKDKDRFEILIMTGLISEEENKLRHELTSFRDKIAHRPGKIFYDVINLEDFKIAEMINLYQKLVRKICEFILCEACRTEEHRLAVIKEVYAIPVGGIKMMAEELLKDEKFKNLIDLFDKRIIIED